MVATAVDRNTLKQYVQRQIAPPLTAATVIPAGVMTMVISGTGTLLNAADAANGLVMGLSSQAVNSLAGDSVGVVELGCFWLANDGNLSAADVGTLAYVLDNQTVTNNATSVNKVIAGKIEDVGARGVLVNMLGLISSVIPSGYGSVATYTQGAISPGCGLAKLSITDAKAFGLANGTVADQIIDIEVTAVAGSPVGTLTIATPFAGELGTYIFHAVGQRIRLRWDGSAWKLIDKRRAGTLAVAVGTTVLTGYVMAATYSLTVDATVHSIGNKGIPAPQIEGEYIRIVTASAINVPLGDIDITGFTSALVAATSLAGINATTCTAMFLSNGVSWDNIAVTTATYS